MTADDEVTITVSRADLERVVYCAQDGGRVHLGAAQRIGAAIPPPPWEPSDEQIAAYLDAKTFGATTTYYAVDSLKRLHAAGLVLP